MKGLLRLKPKNNWSIGRKIRIQGWWNKKIQELLRNGTENSVVVCVAQAKLLILMSLFLVLIP
jgi:hypothetical protein